LGSDVDSENLIELVVVFEACGWREEKAMDFGSVRDSSLFIDRCLIEVIYSKLLLFE